MPGTAEPETRGPGPLRTAVPARPGSAARGRGGRSATRVPEGDSADCMQNERWDAEVEDRGSAGAT